MESAPWLLIFPATFLAVTLFCFNFIGDGLRDALDPKDGEANRPTCFNAPSDPVFTSASALRPRRT